MFEMPLREKIGFSLRKHQDLGLSRTQVSIACLESHNRLGHEG